MTQFTLAGCAYACPCGRFRQIPEPPCRYRVAEKSISFVQSCNLSIGNKLYVLRMKGSLILIMCPLCGMGVLHGMGKVALVILMVALIN